VKGASSILGLGAKLNRIRQEEEDLKMQWASQSFNNNDLIIQSLDNERNSFGEEFSGPIAESIENTNEIMPHSSSLAKRIFSSARRLGVAEQ
jgi:hypothetical protein